MLTIILSFSVRSPKKRTNISVLRQTALVETLKETLIILKDSKGISSILDYFPNKLLLMLDI